MFDFIKKLFGKGYIYADIVCKDGQKGKVKVPYIGDRTTIDYDEIKLHITESCMNRYKKDISTVIITRISK